MMNSHFIQTLPYPDDLRNDPVTKAVYDNIMGKLPTKKPKVSVYCNVCNLEFSSQTVLNTHLAGSKHQRKIKFKELLTNLESTEPGLEKNLLTGVIKCTLCDVTVNSAQLLAYHVAGNKHQAKKGKRVNGEGGEEENQEEGTPAKKLCSDNDAAKSNGDAAPAAEAASTTAPSADADGAEGAAKTGDDAAASAEKKAKKPPPPKKERTPLDIDIPSCVTKLEDNKCGGRFLCNPCQAHCNSDIQLSQHLKSKKHLDKLAGKKPTPSPYASSASRGRTPWKTFVGASGSGRGGRSASSNTRVLTSTAPAASSWGDSFSSGLGLGVGGANGSYGHAYADSSALASGLSHDYGDAYALGSGLSSGYSDSYGLSSLGRGLSDYSYERPSAAASRSAAAASRTASYPRSSDPYSSRAVAAADPYARSVDHLYDRAAYAAAAEYPIDDLGSYAATDYAHGYAAAPSIAPAAASSSRAVPFTYTAPLSHNFVAGSSIL